jgi:hypothetical protein
MLPSSGGKRETKRESAQVQHVIEERSSRYLRSRAGTLDDQRLLTISIRPDCDAIVGAGTTIERILRAELLKAHSSASLLQPRDEPQPATTRSSPREQLGQGSVQLLEPKIDIGKPSGRESQGNERLHINLIAIDLNTCRSCEDKDLAPDVLARKIFPWIRFGEPTIASLSHQFGEWATAVEIVE